MDSHGACNGTPLAVSNGNDVGAREKHDGENELRNEAFYLAMILEGHSRFECFISTISAPNSIDIIDLKKQTLSKLTFVGFKIHHGLLAQIRRKYQRVVAPDGRRQSMNGNLFKLTTKIPTADKYGSWYVIYVQNQY